MKPYGNQHMHVKDELNSTKCGKVSSVNRRMSRRLAAKSRRAKDKAAVRQSATGIDEDA